MSEALRITLVTVAALLLPACGQAKPPPAPIVVTLTVDGAEVATFTTRQIAERVPLRGRLPADLWELEATTADARALWIPEFAKRYSDHELVLYLTGTQPTLGVFRRSRPDQPTHVRAALAVAEVALVGVKQISIEHGAPLAAPPPTPPDLAITIDGRATILAAAAWPPITQRGGRSGWELGAVLDAAGIPESARLVARGADGELAFTRAELDARSTLRLTNRGELRLGIESGSERHVMRGVVAIVATSK